MWFLDFLPPSSSPQKQKSLCDCGTTNGKVIANHLAKIWMRKEKASTFAIFMPTDDDTVDYERPRCLLFAVNYYGHFIMMKWLKFVVICIELDTPLTVTIARIFTFSLWEINVVAPNFHELQFHCNANDCRWFRGSAVHSLWQKVKWTSGDWQCVRVLNSANWIKSIHKF